ncbi:hypothetical protein [Algoriphagus marincola]|uniref:hypothetical protein n=1 Tax=Algoriphagus marincola TaxID=264027 RepID=UPI000412CEF4|nr:hypothetical protein [Algoriphagus marincola]
MCEIDWDIIQKFTDSLIWPVFLLGLFLLFKKQITKLIDRITYDSEQIEIGGLLKAQLKQIEKIKETAGKGEQPTVELTKQLISATVLIQLEGIKQLGEDYTHSSFDQRRIIESRIKEYSVGLTTNDIQPLLMSTDSGHRIASAIALEQILYRNNIDPFDDNEVKEFIIKSLDDSSSFLRYETLQLVFTSQRLIDELKVKLNKMKDTDKNSAIRSLIKMFVR